ncbi:hypothetical protein [Actinoplanes sp. NPDC051494]|uniref:hypothetical protein n=1 Tax=Actinoplanes sp. NPDC051494 TaxID=3363907 RepID=UPI0037A00829
MSETPQDQPPSPGEPYAAGTDGPDSILPGGDETDTAADDRPSGWRTRAARFSAGGSEVDPAKRRRRRWFLGAVGAGAALIVAVLCAGGVAVVAAVSGFRDDADELQEERQVHNAACLELEGQLNRLVPPGATTATAARADAVRDENAALRIYIGQLPAGRAADGWRQLVDARTAYAEALGGDAPAFYAAPRDAEGRAVSDELVRLSPSGCAGPIRRLQAPDL